MFPGIVKSHQFLYIVHFKKNDIDWNQQIRKKNLILRMHSILRPTLRNVSLLFLFFFIRKNFSFLEHTIFQVLRGLKRQNSIDTRSKPKQYFCNTIVNAADQSLHRNPCCPSNICIKLIIFHKKHFISTADSEPARKLSSQTAWLAAIQFYHLTKISFF